MNVVDHCAGIDGTLSTSSKYLIEHMLQGGDANVWRQAREVVISPLPLMTLGMAVKRVTRHAIADVPDPFTIYRALRFSLNRQTQFRDHPDVADMES